MTTSIVSKGGSGVNHESTFKPCGMHTLRDLHAIVRHVNKDTGCRTSLSVAHGCPCCAVLFSSRWLSCKTPPVEAVDPCVVLPTDVTQVIWVAVLCCNSKPFIEKGTQNSVHPSVIRPWRDERSSPFAKAVLTRFVVRLGDPGSEKEKGLLLFGCRHRRVCNWSGVLRIGNLFNAQFVAHKHKTGNAWFLNKLASDPRTAQFWKAYRHRMTLAIGRALASASSTWLKSTELRGLRRKGKVSQFLWKIDTSCDSVIAKV